MEALTALIARAVHDGLLSPLVGCSAAQRLSVYADDIVIFVRPTVVELTALRDLLSVFGSASGLQVNYNKSSATLIRGNELLIQRTE
jgi:hypothetical protein